MGDRELIKKPNIICISVDSLRADYCSLINNEGADTTPFLCSLAEESTVFESAIAPSNWSLPSHASIFTGLFPPEHGIYSGSAVLGDHKTFAEILSENGYSTRSFNRNGWIDTADMLRGFEERLNGSTSVSSSNNISYKRKTVDLIGEISPFLKKLFEKIYEKTVLPPKRVTNLYRAWNNQPPSIKTDDGQLIKEVISSIDCNNQPFCWFISLLSTHWKYAPPAPYHQSFTNKSTPELIFNYYYWQNKIYGSKEQLFKAQTGNINIPSKEVSIFKDLYKGCIQYVDHLICKLVSELKRSGVWDDTILIIFADHGDSFGESNVFGHHFSMDDSLLHVPLFIRDPTGRIENERVSSPVSLVDIYPTLLNTVGLEHPNTDGIDLAVTKRDCAYAYYEIPEHKFEFYNNPSLVGVSKADLPPSKQMVAWRSKDEKVISYPDIDKHIKFGDSDEDLIKHLKTYTSNLSKIEPRTRDIDESTEERLKEMGYL